MSGLREKDVIFILKVITFPRYNRKKTVKAVNIYESNSTSDSDSENEWFLGRTEIKYEDKDTVSNDEINTTDLGSVEIETIDPKDAQSD